MLLFIAKRWEKKEETLTEKMKSSPDEMHTQTHKYTNFYLNLTA